MSNQRKEGVLVLDHRASPGLPDNFFRDIGLNGPVAGEGKLFEAAVKTCVHCGIPQLLNPDRTRPRGYCPKCDGYVCDNKACHDNCTPFDKILDNAENAAYRAQQAAMTPLILRKDFTNG